MTWKNAIISVLQENRQGNKYVPMHYRDITDLIIEKRLVDSYGQTPANTVSRVLTTTKTLFSRVNDGEYSLTEEGQKYVIHNGIKFNKHDLKNSEGITTIFENVTETLIPTYGMFWLREGINWDNHPKLLGVQSTGATPIDLSEMRGIYMLYDGREVVYVGQAIDRPILKRLQEHTKNRLATRWNRFSWFSLDSIHPESGNIVKVGNLINTSLHVLANALEGILIEGIEPRQNRKQGDNFGFEYYQEIDREILKDKYLSELKKL